MGEGEERRAAIRVKGAEVGVALLFLALGGLVIYDSVRLGIGWQEVHGPQPGYFPFYVGAIIAIAAVVNLVRALLVPGEKNGTFVQLGQLKLVLTAREGPLVESPRRQPGRGGRLFPDLRDLVQGPAAQGPRRIVPAAGLSHG